jgi:hypothetical protein
VTVTEASLEDDETVSCAPNVGPAYMMWSAAGCHRLVARTSTSAGPPDKFGTATSSLKGHREYLPTSILNRPLVSGSVSWQRGKPELSSLFRK